MPTLVQFLHTAIEAEPEKNTDTYIPWNNHETHRRKFIVSEGKFLNLDDNEENNKLTFWGEWEAQSKIEKINKGNQMPPKYFNYPFINPSVVNRTHNTDPNVFGDHFKYIICKQAFFHNILTKLKPNSIILFGSCIDDKFCLDTLFVVSSTIKNYQLNEIEKLFPERGQYYHASVNPIYDDTHCNPKVDKEDSCRIDDISRIYTYYESVSYPDRNSFNEMYSYVPCKIFKEGKNMESTFRQPQINLDFIKHKQTQGINAKECEFEETKAYWDQVSQQIHEKELKKGTYFKVPTLR